MATLYSSPSTQDSQYSTQTSLLSLGKTDLTVAQVVDAVPPAQESIAEDSERAHRLGEVHTHEGANAGALHLKDVVVRADGEVVTAQGNGQVGE